MSGKLRFAVIGCGRMGIRRMKAISTHPKTELVCLSDNDVEAARKYSKEMGCDFHQEWEMAVGRRDVDFVVISVPNKLHNPIAVEALNQGKHVWCEKPLARNPEEAKQIVRAAARTGSFLKVGSNLRYFPSVQKAKQLVDSGAIGDILFLRGWVGNAGWPTKMWFSDAELSGGGTFLDNGCHLLDLARWFMGEARECTGRVSTLHWEISPLEDNGMGIFTFDKGKLAFIHSSWTEWSEYMYMEIYGSTGYIRVDNRGAKCIAVRGGRDGKQDVYDYSDVPAQSHTLEFNDCIQSIEQSMQPLPDGFDGLRAVQMAYGVYESSKSGRSVKIWSETEERLLEQLQGKG
jgi:predicted dehydrogenase